MPQKSQFSRLAVVLIFAFIAVLAIFVKSKTRRYIGSLEIRPQAQHLQMLQGAASSFVFSLINDSRTTIRFTNIQPSCGCVQVHIIKEILKSGEKTSLVGMFYSNSKLGDSGVLISIIAIDTFGRTIQTEAKVFANVELPVSVIPSFLDFGIIHSDDPSTFREALLRKETTLIAWDNMEVTNSPVPYSLNRQSDNSYILAATLDPKRSNIIGTIMGDIDIVLTNHSIPLTRFQTVRVPVYARITSAIIRSSPETLYFGFVKPDVANKVVLSISVLDGHLLVIGKIHLEHSTKAVKITSRLLPTADTGVKKIELQLCLGQGTTIKSIVCVQLSLDGRMMELRVPIIATSG